MNHTKITNPDLSWGVIVSTLSGRGHYHTDDFNSDIDAVQHAYDDMVTRSDLPRTLILDAPDRPFEFDGYLDIWQSKCRITSTGGDTIIPKAGYTGPLIQTGMREGTELGEDGVISNVVIDHIWLNGNNQSIGIKLKDLQLSTIHNVHVRRTDGPGLWISDGCIENMFSQIVLSDECGNEQDPALLIQPESATRSEQISNHNLTVNSTYFSGVMIHFPKYDALRISGGPMAPEDCKYHRKIQFNGCFFHTHPRNTKPVVTIEDAMELTFVGTQMLAWNDEGVVMQIGSSESRVQTSVIMISHCIFGSKPKSKTTGIRLENVDTNGPCVVLFGNSFGSRDGRLAHAVDWGNQEGKKASWAGNAVFVSEQPHIGKLPADADISPFHGVGR